MSYEFERDPELALASLHEEMRALQRELAPRYPSMSKNQIDEFLEKRVKPLRQEIKATMAVLARIRKARTEGGT
jgi:hypothetical protein